jgi:hypothetical protein
MDNSATFISFTKNIFYTYFSHVSVGYLAAKNL